MKKYFLSFLFSILCLSINAQPAYLAGNSSGFNELNSSPSGTNMTVETRLNTTVAIKTCSAKADYSAWFKFTSSNNSWSPQWSTSGSEKTITTNTYLSSTAEYVTGQNLKVDVLSGKYYTFIVGQNATTDNDLSVLLSYEAPKTISSITNAIPAENIDIQVSATLSSAIGVTSGDGAQYVRLSYTIDNTSYVTVDMSGSGSTYTANIPASVNTDGTTVKYFVFVTPISNLTPSTADFDYLYFTKSNANTYCIGCVSNPITVKAKRPSSWTNDMYIFYWGGEISSPSWSDAELMESIGNGWYSYTFDPTITSTNIIFRNVNDDTNDLINQTVDINTVSADACYELSQGGSSKATYSVVDCSNINQDVDAPEIRAHRNTVNENDFSDFASLYVYSNGNLNTTDFTGATKYLWQKSTDGSVWSTFSEGRKYNINNIRPVKAGYYRCLVSKYCVSASKDSTLISNQIQVTNTSGSTKTISSNLPIIIVRTDVKDFPVKPGGYGFLSSNEALAAGKEKISVDVKIIWDEISTDDQTNTYVGSDVTNMSRLYYDKKARMNYRGASSMNYDRRNYAFVVGDDSCTVSGTWVKDKKKMFNLNETKDKDWILYAAHTDNTKMRNLLSMNLYEDMTGTWNSHGRYVRLYVNGVDMGIYIFMEKNKQESSRIQVAEDGYIFKFDKTDIVDRVSSTEGDRCTFITNKTGWQNIGTYGLTIDQGFEVVYPEWDEADFTQAVWNERMSALKNRINDFETALAAGNYATVRNYIDYESWADNFIINEYTKNVDGYRISQFFNMSSATGLIKAAPLWDMELGFNNSSAYGASEKGCTSTSGLMAENSAVHSDSFTIPFWWTGSDKTYKGYGLLNDDCFKAKVKERWLIHTAAGGALNESNVQTEINKLASSLNVSAPSVITDWVNTTSGRPEGLNSIISAYPTYISSASMSDVSNVALGSAAQMTVSVSGTGSYTYAWYFCTTNSTTDSDWTLLTDNGSATYSISSAKTTDDGFYRCVVTSQVCDCINKSVTARLSISAVNVIVYPDDDSMGSVTGGGSYPKGSNVTITAVPNPGYEFSRWDDGNTDNPRIFNDVQEEIEYAAIFEAAQYTLSISSGAGGTVNTAINGTYAYGTVKELIASANEGYQFVSWSDGNLEATRSLTLTSDTTLTASFDVIKYLITVNAGVGGIVSGGGSYEYNSNITISATANAGYSFNQWNDGVSTASRSIVVNSDATYTASFTLNTYTISVTSGTGGSVNSVSGTYNYGSSVELIATPAANYHFVSWSDGNTESTRTITVSSAVNLVASFAIDTYSVSVTAGTGGSVNSVNGTYNYGTELQLIATPSANYHFVSWSDGSTESTRTITVSSAVNLVASFAIDTYTVSISSGSGGTVNTAINGTYNYGSSVELIATPSANYHFVSWNDGNTESTRTITVTSAVSLTASFAIDTYTVSVTSGTGGSVNSVSGTYSYGSSVELIATPAAHYHFVSWSDGNTESTRTITVSSAVNLVASFAIDTYTVSISAGSGGTVNTAINGTYNYGSSVELIATPSANYHFVSWNDGNTESTRTITVSSAVSLTASFAIDTYNVSVTAGTGGSVNSVNGSYDYGTELQLIATPAAHYHFVSWSDGNTESTRTITVTSNVSLTASFATDIYSVSVTASTGGSVNSVNGTYNYGTELQLIATPSANYHFVSWSDGSTESTRTITVSSAVNLVASFAIDTYTVSISSGSGGTVNTAINGTYNYGSSVELIATPSANYHFVSWNDGNTESTRTITVTSAVSLTASFAIDTYSVSVTSGTGGSVNSVSGTYNYGTEIQLIATPAANYHFVSWSDGNTESTRTITVTDNINLVASFAIDTHTVSVLKSGAGGSVSGGGTFNYGANITISASPYAGYKFKQWNDGSIIASRTVLVTEDIAYIAQFEKQQYTLTISAGANGSVNTEVNGTYEFGTSVNIIATPNANSSFVSWSDGDVNASRSITINNNIVLEAQFAINNYTLNISALANGTVNTEVNGTYPSGSNITIKAIPNDHYNFFKWSDGDKNAQRVLTLTKNTTLYASFTIDTHALLITSNGNGTVNSEVNKNYKYGTSVEIIATPNEHADFVSWSDGDTNPIRTVVMNEDITLSATFSLKRYELQVSSGSNGTVNSEISGNYVYGSIVSLKAIPNEHYHFDSWSDGTTNAEYDIVITKDENLTASFAIDRYELAIVTDNDKGSVNSEVNGEYDYNTPVTIIATPNVGFTFKYWSDGSTDSERIVNMTENISLSAIFEVTHCTLNISAVGNGTVNTEVNDVYDYGTEVELIVTANNHCHLESWSDGSTELVRTITLVSDSAIVAYIEPDRFTISATIAGVGHVEGTGTYEYNTEITITAVPDEHNHFTVWSDGEANAERTVIVTSDMHFVANFAIDEHTINVVAGDHGVVNSGVNGNYNYGTQLTIRAAANLHYHFDSWSDGSVEIERIIELTQDTTLIANFAIDQFAVYSATVGNGNIEGAGIYDYGTNVTITAVPDAHNHFVSWSDGDINAVRQIVLISDITMTAEFAIDKHTVTLASNGNGSVEGGGDFDYDSEITIKAIPDYGYTFDGWNDGNTETERVITVKENLSYTAFFKETVSIEDAIKEEPHVFAQGRTIYIIAPNANSIIVYDKIGKIRGTNVASVTVPYAGVYFVKIDSKTYKLTVY